LGGEEMASNEFFNDWENIQIKGNKTNNAAMIKKQCFINIMNTFFFKQFSSLLL